MEDSSQTRDAVGARTREAIAKTIIYTTARPHDDGTTTQNCEPTHDTAQRNHSQRHWTRKARRKNTWSTRILTKTSVAMEMRTKNLATGTKPKLASTK